MYLIDSRRDASLPLRHALLFRYDRGFLPCADGAVYTTLPQAAGKFMLIFLLVSVKIHVDYSHLNGAEKWLNVFATNNLQLI